MYMHYFTEMAAAISYIEAHVTEPKLDPKDLQSTIGFSFAHIRDIFQHQTGVPLIKYLLTRKIMNSTFDLLYSGSTILDIALKYGFNSHETYTRAFKRVMNVTPMEYRRQRISASCSLLCSGVYGITLHNQKRSSKMSEMSSQANGKEKDSTILYGVPKVGYGIYGDTPYPVCLKACSNYLGEDIDYAFTMVSSGAAFRLTWDRSCWNLGNVDIWNTYDEPWRSYKVGVDALGRKFDFMERTSSTTKDDFISFIRSHIDEGYPCIALGIIGPPEAGIIAGYLKDGNQLAGWNFFQDNPQFGGKVDVMENGYYLCDTWWENTDTQALFSMGEVIGERMTIQQIIANAATILQGRETGSYAKGLSAYDAWKDALLNEKDFQQQDNLSLQIEKLMTHDDAMVCLLDGRGNASKYFDQLAKSAAEHVKEYGELAKNFYHTFSTVQQMVQVLGGWDDKELHLKKFLQPEVRKELAHLIEKAKQYDSDAYNLLLSLK